MMMRNLYLFLFILSYLNVFSQGENDNWYFGDHAGVNFFNPNPVVLTNGQLSTMEACGTVSDTSGQLLFYTNGVTVWTREHQVMVNGNSLSGNLSSQQLIIVKDPGNINRYYIFTTGVVSLPNSFIAYTIVDMSLGAIGTNGQPLGEVLSNHKNIPVLDPNGNKMNTEAVTAVTHSDGSSYWILIPYNKSLYSYKLDNSGFNTTPVASALNFSQPLLNANHFGIKASPLLKNKGDTTHYICITSLDYGGRLYSYHNGMGSLINTLTLHLNTTSRYSSEFNKDGSVLYLARHTNAVLTGAVFSVDLVNSTTMPIFYQLNTNNFSYSEVQRNKYGEIYLSSLGSNYLAKIINPDTFGASSISYYDTYLNGNKANLGLPQLILSHDNEEVCTDNLYLTTPEVNTTFHHQAQNTIVMSGNYSIANGSDIKMNAGSSIDFLPNTTIAYGADYLGEIADCTVAKPVYQTQSSPIYLTLDLDTIEQQNGIQYCEIYPNPASSYFTINTNKEELERWEIYDAKGKLVHKGKEYSGNVNNLASAIYMIRIYLKNGSNETQKIVIK